jgi:hypothetical protein
MLHTPHSTIDCFDIKADTARTDRELIALSTVDTANLMIHTMKEMQVSTW